MSAKPENERCKEIADAMAWLEMAQLGTSHARVILDLIERDSGEPVAWRTRGMLGNNEWDGWRLISEAQAHRLRNDPAYKNGRRQIEPLYAAPPASQALAEPVAKMADALENLLIAIGMGWDLDGVVEVVRDTIAEQSGSQFVGDVSSLIAARCVALPGALIDCPVCGAVDKERDRLSAEAQARVEALEAELRVALSAYAGIIDLGGKLDLFGSNLELVESAHARVTALLSGSTPKPAGDR